MCRSRSWKFMRDSRPRSFGKPVASYAWNGKPIFYRPGGSDPECIYKILILTSRKGDYWVPEEVAPEVILDIGANIGIASIYFASRFPKAAVHAFEPVAENFSLLERNTLGYQQVKAYHVALGEKAGPVEIALSATGGEGNYGGFSFHYHKRDKVTQVMMENPASFFPKIGISKVDLIKIDTEGHEYEILRAFDQQLLRGARWIIGELHGIKDFALLEYLSQWFDIAVRKDLKKLIYRFNACNKEFVERIKTPHQTVQLGVHRG